jgi:hypothetical protein
MKLSRRFSLHQFAYFLKLVGKDGLVHGSTLELWREAAREFEIAFTRNEKQDLRCVDIRQLSQRYVSSIADTRSSVTPWRVLMLESVMAAALGDFIAFTINPIRYRENRSLLKRSLRPESAVA